jgi:Metallo-beta-lactamase superfamily
MKLTVFHANDGDCLMLESATDEHVLIDGGREGTFQKNTQPALDKLVAEDRPIDLLVVSHIDADHISGVLPLLNAVEQWVSFDNRKATSPAEERDSLPEPSVPRPPEIKGLWHNSWRNQLGKLADPVIAIARSVREAVSLTVGDSEDERQKLAPAALAMSNLATSMEQGELLIDLVEQAGLPIPFNAPFKGLVKLRKPVHTQTVGGGVMKLSVLGPSDKHLKTLKAEWQAWVDELPKADTSSGSRRGGGNSLARGLTLETAVASAESLIASVAESAKSIAAAENIPVADASIVTTPNRASIVLLAEEGGRTCLLTGDAAEPEILDGLRAAGRLNGEPFGCNVLKVQHHGAEHNLSQTFAENVIADHYVFCGDGASGNPNPDVIETIVQARRRVGSQTPYTLWFNTSATRPKSASKRAVMKAAIATARAAARKQPNRISVNVLKNTESSFTIDV